MFVSSSVDPTNLNPSLIVLSWPELAFAPLFGVLLGLVPAFLSPPPESLYASFEDEPETVVEGPGGAGLRAGVTVGGSS
jgi:energy-coupling factor transport system permease protein